MYTHCTFRPSGRILPNNVLSGVYKRAEKRKMYHLIAIFETSKGHFCYTVLLMRRLFRREERGIGSQREVNAREAVGRKD
jgi:hypothetical protein